jgi:uncharacterized protein YodC (DUF2158 family)
MAELKSGGPEMTIANIGNYGSPSGEDEARCVWFEGKKKCEEIFSLDVLKKVGKKKLTSDSFRLKR